LPDGNAQVVDFKTGKANKTAQQLGEYRRQLDFYKLLWDGSGESRTLVRGMLDFVEDAPGETVNRLVFEYDDERIATLRETIRLFRTSLESMEFPEVNPWI
jgi:RecB family exonuclease